MSFERRSFVTTPSGTYTPDPRTTVLGEVSVVGEGTRRFYRTRLGPAVTVRL
jgi:hypothetical protein